MEYIKKLTLKYNMNHFYEKNVSKKISFFKKLYLKGFKMVCDNAFKIFNLTNSCAS